MLTVPYIPSRQYIGARYVPKPVGDWDITKEYEPLLVVYYNGASYTSKTYVPAGIDISNTTYWVLSADYNAQVAAYREEVLGFSEELHELENVLGDNESLLTIDNSVFGAINENFINSKFNAQRIGSKVVSDHEGQYTLYYDGYYWSCGEDTDNSAFNIVKINNMLETVTAYPFNEDCHPNAMFVYNEHFYVVDSRNSQIFVIKISTMTISDTIDLSGEGIISGYFYEDKFYLATATSTVLVYDLSFTLLDTITLDSFSNPIQNIQQTIFIYDDYIYKIYNKPNMLAVFDIEGHLIAVKNIGIGSGFFPYGEVENLFIKDTHIYMSTSLWSASPSSLNSILQIFNTNIIEAIGNDSQYGQSTEAHARMYIDNTGDRVLNPIGTSDKPFQSLFEGGAVYNYLYRLYGHYAEIETIGTFTGEAMILSNCQVTLHNTSSVIDYLYLYGCTVNLSRQHINNLVAEYSRLFMQRSTLGSIICRFCAVFFGGSKLTTSSNMSHTNIFDSDLYCTAALADINWDASYCDVLRDNYRGEPSITTSPHNISTFVQGCVFNMLANQKSRLHINLFGSDAINYEVNLTLTNADKTTINGGGTINKHVGFITYFYDQYAQIQFDLAITKSTITLSNLSKKDMSGVDISRALIFDAICSWKNENGLT